MGKWNVAFVYKVVWQMGVNKEFLWVKWLYGCISKQKLFVMIKVPLIADNIEYNINTKMNNSIL